MPECEETGHAPGLSSPETGGLPIGRLIGQLRRLQQQPVPAIRLNRVQGSSTPQQVCGCGARTACRGDLRCGGDLLRDHLVRRLGRCGEMVGTAFGVGISRGQLRMQPTHPKRIVCRRRHLGYQRVAEPEPSGAPAHQPLGKRKASAAVPLGRRTASRPSAGPALRQEPPWQAPPAMHRAIARVAPVEASRLSPMPACRPGRWPPPSRRAGCHRCVARAPAHRDVSPTPRRARRQRPRRVPSATGSPRERAARDRRALARRSASGTSPPPSRRRPRTGEPCSESPGLTRRRATARRPPRRRPARWRPTRRPAKPGRS